MKPRHLRQLLALLSAAMLLLSACGGSNTEGAAEYSAESSYAEEPAAEAYDADYGDSDYNDGDGEYAEGEAQTNAAPAPSAESAGASAGSGFDSSSAVDLSKYKIIRRANISIATEAYDQTIQLIQKAVNDANGYIENMDLNGTAPTEAYVDGRYGDVTLRVPSAHFDKTLSALRKGGEVTHESISSENVSARYRDTEAHITSIETHMESLDKLMAQTTKLEDMLRLEEEISRLRYEKEGLESSLRSWDDLVSYSTITVSLWEVNTITPVLETPEEAEDFTFGEQAGHNFRSAWRGFVGGLKQAALALLSIWPGLLIFLVAAFFFLRYMIKCQRKMNEERKAAQEKAAQQREQRRITLSGDKEAPADEQTAGASAAKPDAPSDKQPK